MYKGKTITAIIPCYNEEEGISRVMQKLPDEIDEVIVVDGGSTDKTAEFALKGGAEVIVERRRGYGLAYKVGFQKASGDVIVTGDGDATYPIESLKEIMDNLIENDFDFVSASRFPLRRRNSMLFRNFMGNVIISTLSTLLFKVKITDVLSGMWVFKKNVLKKMELLSNGWNFSEEIKIEALIHKEIKFGEYPIIYYEREGETKLLPWKVGIENVLFLFYKRIRTIIKRTFKYRRMDQRR